MDRPEMAPIGVCVRGVGACREREIEMGTSCFDSNAATVNRLLLPWTPLGGLGVCRSAHLRRGHRTVNRPPCYGGRLVCRTGGVAGGAWRHCALCVRDGLWLTAGWGWDVGLEVAVAMAVAVGVSSDWRRGRSRNRSKSLGVQCKGVVFSRFLFCACRRHAQKRVFRIPRWNL